MNLGPEYAARSCPRNDVGRNHFYVAFSFGFKMTFHSFKMTFHSFKMTFHSFKMPSNITSNGMLHVCLAPPSRVTIKRKD